MWSPSAALLGTGIDVLIMQAGYVVLVKRAAPAADVFPGPGPR